MGSYFSEIDGELAAILFGPDFSGRPSDERSVAVSARTGEALGVLRRRLGQKQFSDNVVSNYDGACCFPGCDVRDRVFLIGAHIDRWSDNVEQRGETANGLALCLLHDKAFEHGWFVLDNDRRVRVNIFRIGAAECAWTRAHLAPHEGLQIRRGDVLPSVETLAAHRLRIGYAPS